ncbi:PepSY-like domain-containing protein [Cytophaga aurantiaca]|uniref:PepSY-like domain-containing protein n=1 Tax=Cytophaga aurantiaca TaxID=29530 RepID=UPI0009FD40C5|nr:PepSY-like domain-containing protein [Cytophaga aurantiaca]
MKYSILFMFVVCTFFNAVAQERKLKSGEVPSQISSYLMQQYPAAEDIEYYHKKEKDSTFYEVEFELSNADYNLKFSVEGELLETEKEIDFDELSPILKEKILIVMKDNFRKSKIEKVQEVDPIGIKRYEVTAKVKHKGKKNNFENGVYTLLFDQDGRLLKMEQEVLNSIDSVF